ncbi:MAG: lysophospholipid acyltransferase family protein [Candidatus Omnitrophota bacterium]|nr:lysophospholipid acyltransferase family protein [Candidatus Omnitrophota bacterium]
MDFKKIRKSALRFLSWVGLTASSLIIKLIPACLLYKFADIVSFLAYRFAVKQRQVALESLAIAFGQDKTKEQMERIARDCFIFMAKSAVELMFLMDKPLILKERVSIEGRENLDLALTGGCGVILVSAHFGNFPLLLGRLAVGGYKAAGIMKPMHDARVEKIFLEKRNKFGVKTIYSQPRDVCVNNTIQALRNNELVFIPIDQNFGSGGVFVTFFGKKAATAAGPIILSQRTHAALLPCFIIRQPDDTHKIIFEPALKLEEGENSQDTILINTQKLTNIIEAYIRKYPAEWGWIHRRWKRQPEEV